jgi:hypothetical protein
MQEHLSLKYSAQTFPMSVHLSSITSIDIYEPRKTSYLMCQRAQYLWDRQVSPFVVAANRTVLLS